MENADLYFTVSTAGHVDHGKTSVLKKLTGIDPDRLKEEKQRQMTTDLGFAHIHLPHPTNKEITFHVGFIDVPGHGKFIKNMIAGVGALDLALLIVAADEGPMPQTEQHMEILSLLGVRQVLLAVNKVDLVGPDKVKSTTKLCEELLSRFELKLLDTVPISCALGSGFDELKQAIAGALAKHESRTVSSLRNMPAYMPIDRAFSITGHGLVVTGTLVRGQIKHGDTLLIEPIGAKARVRGLETFGQTIQEANPGQRLALNLAVKDHGKVARGQSLGAVAVVSTKSVLVDIESFDQEIEKSKEDGIKPQPVRLYHGTAEIAGFLSWCESLVVPDASAKIRSKQSFLAQIVLDEPLIAEPGERILIRYGEEGLGGGVILLKSRPRWLTRPQVRHLCQLLKDGSFEDSVLWFTQNCPQKMLKKAAVEMFVPPATRAALLNSIVSHKKLVEIEDLLLTDDYQQTLSKEIVARLGALEASQSAIAKRQGITLEQLRTAISPLPDRTIFTSIVDSLCRQGTLEKEGEKLASAQAKKSRQASGVSEQLLKRVNEELANQLCIEVKVLAQSCRITFDQMMTVINELERQNTARIIAHEFVSSADAIAKAHEALAAIWQEKQQIAPTDFKERLNISRKYAMALLSYFDDALITRRLANGRVLLKTPKRN